LGADGGGHLFQLGQRVVREGVKWFCTREKREKVGVLHDPRQHDLVRSGDYHKDGRTNVDAHTFHDHHDVDVETGRQGTERCGGESVAVHQVRLNLVLLHLRLLVNVVGPHRFDGIGLELPVVGVVRRDVELKKDAKPPVIGMEGGAVRVEIRLGEHAKKNKKKKKKKVVLYLLVLFVVYIKAAKFYIL
jgi:hypothetical protein